MSREIVIEKYNEVYIKVHCEKSVAYDLKALFTFYVNAQNHQKFKKGKWDGAISLFNMKTGLIYKGLYEKILAWCEEKNIEVISSYDPKYSDVPPNLVDDIVAKFKSIHELHPHQRFALEQFLKKKNLVILSSTSSGKSYIIYFMILILLKIFRGPGKTLIVVPTKNLVDQIYNDFKSYSKLNGFDTENNVHRIYEGQSKVTDCPVIVSTWQSIYNMDASYFEQFEAVIGDECHRFKAKSLKTIMEGAINAKYKVGLSGSLDGSEVNELTLNGLFGPIVEASRTHKLMKDGLVAELNINVMILRHHDTKTISNKEYAEQKMFLSLKDERNKFIRRLVANEKGNRLVLFELVDSHGIPLYEKFKEEYPDKEVYYISGETDIKERERIRTILSQTNDAVLFASYGTYSTGMNVPSLRHVFSTFPGKSRIKTLQSIGRSLRLDDGKSKAVFWDIADVMVKKDEKSVTHKHLEERIKLYIRERFKIKTFEIDIA
jgi:superfamily II DNA or RNA helicase